MNNLMLTRHAAMRMAQRGIKLKDAELIALIGTEVADGYLVRVKDYQEIERAIKGFLDQFRRVVGKRLVVNNGQIVTAYCPSKNYRKRLIRNVHDRELCE